MRFGLVLLVVSFVRLLILGTIGIVGTGECEAFVPRDSGACAGGAGAGNFCNG